MNKKIKVSAKKSKHISTVPKFIKWIAKFLFFVHPIFAEKFATKLFTTPIKYKIPKREFHMEEQSNQSNLYIPSIDKQIVVYEYGKSNKKVLLVHGWSGRGTQLVKIADVFLENGFSTISFDAPAHGKSETSTTLLIEFIESILEVENKYGPFEFAVGHSLGSMAILNAIKDNLQIEKAIIIASGNSVINILNSFVKKIELPNKIAQMMKNSFEKKYNFELESFSSYKVANKVNIPVLVIHDNNDEDIPVTEAHHLIENLKNKEVLITNNLGHRKILGDKQVIDKIVEFLLIKK